MLAQNFIELSLGNKIKFFLYFLTYNPLALQRNQYKRWLLYEHSLALAYFLGLNKIEK